LAGPPGYSHRTREEADGTLLASMNLFRIVWSQKFLFMYRSRSSMLAAAELHRCGAARAGEASSRSRL